MLACRRGGSHGRNYPPTWWPGLALGDNSTSRGSSAATRASRAWAGRPPAKPTWT